MQIHFVSFGGPSENYVKAVERLREQAIRMNVFSSISIYTHKDLTNFVHKKFMDNNPRGYGYWIWKAYIIEKTLLQLPEGDLLMYLDAGCELNHYGKRRLFELIPTVLNKKIIGTHSISNDITYTKKATRDAIHCDSALWSKNHMQAGYLFMCNCSEIRELMRDWNYWNSHYELINDNLDGAFRTEGPTAANSEFIEHRHDQSIFNLLVKSRGLHNYDAEPADVRINNPVWYCRNRDGVPLQIERPY
jgi:hypothetical protein